MIYVLLHINEFHIHHNFEGADYYSSYFTNEGMNLREVKPLGHGHSVEKWRTLESKPESLGDWNSKLYAILSVAYLDQALICNNLK